MKTLQTLAILLLGAITASAETVVYVSVAAEKKIASYRVHPKDGGLTHVSDTATEGEPGALTTDPDRKLLFAALRAEGKLSAFRISPATGKLTPLNTVEAGADPAHISVDRSGRFLLCAYYVAAKVTVHAIGLDGKLSKEPVATVKTADKAHAVVLDGENQVAIVPHTGPNKIYALQFNEHDGSLLESVVKPIQTPDGRGPRHVVFNSQSTIAYVANEQGGSVTVFRFAHQSRMLTEKQTLSTLPADFKGTNACAEIRLHPTGRFLYLSNRGHDSLAGFQVGEGGKLTALGQTKTEQTPRSFDIEPDGKYLYAAGESSGKLSTYSIDTANGALKALTTRDVGKMPWWVMAVRLPVLKESASELLAQGKTVLSQLSGDMTLTGLRDPVEVLRDRWGIPHIYAKNQDDLFFAQGFVAAQDRLFQIDIWRRQGLGEMAEVLGPRYLAADRFARLMKYRGDMEAEWQSYSPDTKVIAARFTEGINTCIEQMGEKLPIEFQMLGFKPKKWRPEDILHRMSGIYMSQNFRNEIARARLIASVGIEKARWLAPVDPAREYASALNDEELKAIDKNILADYEAAVKALSFTPATTESNNWVISGKRSASGKPLLASDPHRAIALPSLRYMVHLNAPGWNVIGSGEPALPGVAIGHNDKIAWGFTIVGTDQADFYVEVLNPDNPQEYMVDGKWARMTMVRETIAIKDGKEQTVDLFYSRHGPVFYRDLKRNRAYALKWVGNEPGGAAYLASLAVDRVNNQKEFLEAMGRWHVPGLNFVYADVEGNIGWIAAAKTPLRAKHDGLLPVPGNGGFEWTRYLKVAELAQNFNPDKGYLATANHKIVPDKYPYPIGYEFAPNYRFKVIDAALFNREVWDLEGFRRLQHSEGSVPGLSLARLLRDVDLDPDCIRYQRHFAAWDGSISAESELGSLFALWLAELQERFLSPHVPKDMKALLRTLSGLPVMIEALAVADPRWFGADAKKARDQLLRTTFQAAVKKLHDLPDPQQFAWGQLHKATFRHPLETLDPSAARAFNIGPFLRGGDANTPNNTRYNDKFEQIHGASYRHVIDLADWDKALATSTPGQSGQPGSKHYDDLAPLWAKGEYFPLTFSRKKVESVAPYRLILKPGK